MARLATRFKGKWVDMRLTGEDGYFTCFIIGTAVECGNPCYAVRYEHGGEDLIFMSSVDRIAISTNSRQGTGAKILRLVQKKKKNSVVEN